MNIKPYYYLTMLFFTINAEAQVLYSWSQLKGNQISFRTIIDDKECPSVTIDGKDVGMGIRHTPTESFPVTTCEVNIAMDSEASLGGVRIPTVQAPQAILVIGDTGCGAYAATKDDRGYQDCADNNKWVFPKLIKNAMKLEPDLIIHTGDLHYRATQCKNGLAKCGEDKDGLGYGSWKMEFLDSMAEALKTTPIMFAKGNHENYPHGWEGWNKFFSNAEVASKSNPMEPSDLVRFENANILVLDNSAVKLTEQDYETIKIYKNYVNNSLAKLHREDNKVNIVLSHQPTYSIGYSTPDFKVGKSYHPALFEAMKGINMKNVDFTLHGHIHYFSISKFVDPNIPPQIIVGNSGDHIWLDSHLFAGFAGGPLPELHVNYNNFGFAMIYFDDSEVVLDYFNVNGGKVGSDVLLQNIPMSCVGNCLELEQ